MKAMKETHQLSHYENTKKHNIMESERIIKAFKQGGAGNCVSIAVIKASIQVFGIGGVVQFLKTNENNYSFLMKDGFEGEISNYELNMACEGSKFEHQEDLEIFNYANLCFSAMVKRAQLENHEGAISFEQAINALNNGEYYYLGADWLGLRHHKRSLGLKYIWNNIGVVGASPRHCFFCSHGLVDDYGMPNPISWIEKAKYRFFSYYRIAPEPMY
jgi:hypothetical protein